MPKFLDQITIVPSSAGGIAVVDQSSGVTRWSVDVNGNGSIREYTFVLGRGTPLTTGTGVTNTLVVNRAGKIVKASAVAMTSPTGAALIVDIKKNGTSIWATNTGHRLQIAAAGTTGTQTSFDTTTVAEGDLLTIDVVQVGSTVAGQDVTVQLLVLARNQS